MFCTSATAFPSHSPPLHFEEGEEEDDDDNVEHRF
jgi:hypothetical protein